MRVPCLLKLQDSKTAVVVFAALVMLVLSPEGEEEEEKQLSVMSLLRMILATSLSSTCPISVSLIASALASPAEYCFLSSSILYSHTQPHATACAFNLLDYRLSSELPLCVFQADEIIFEATVKDINRLGFNLSGIMELI